MRSLLRQSVLLLGLALLPAAGQALYLRDKVSWQSPMPASEMVTIADARGWGSNAIWIDARPEEEFEQEHVPGALLLNEDRWNELLPQMLAAGRRKNGWWFIAAAKAAVPAARSRGVCAKRRN